MSIEDKAEEYRSDTFGTQFGRDIAMAFGEGIKWILDKAINFIKQHDGEKVVCYTEDKTDNFIYRFRKAITEESVNS